MDTLSQIALDTVRRLDLLPQKAPVLAMVSGGGDSVALLELLASGLLGDVSVSVLHVNHLLRGEESEADEAFVRERCEALGVPCRIVRYDVAAYAEDNGLNLEDAGRRVRYRFAEEELDAWCASLDKHRLLGRIATGHTRDDRVETFFVRALTGAGPGAFSSIAAQRDRIVRPLIECDRSDVRTWLESRDVAWREDSSNEDTERLRALVRSAIVPIAEQVNPAFRETLSRSMDLLASDDALLSTMAEAFVRDFAEAEPGESVAFEREWMSTLNRAMARRTIRAGLLATFPDATRLDASHIEALTDGLALDGFARDLPYGLRAFDEYGKMFVSRSGHDLPAVAPSLLPIPGNTDLGPAGVIVAQEVDPASIERGADAVTIDASLIRGELVIDGPRPGDRMRPFGMDGTRKLQDLLTDAKVPKRHRPAVPVIRDGDRIVWVAGVRMSDEYRVTAETRRAVRLEWDRGHVFEVGGRDD